MGRASRTLAVSLPAAGSQKRSSPGPSAAPQTTARDLPSGAKASAPTSPPLPYRLTPRGPKVRASDAAGRDAGNGSAAPAASVADSRVRTIGRKRRTREDLPASAAL